MLIGSTELAIYRSFVNFYGIFSRQLFYSYNILALSHRRVVCDAFTREMRVLYMYMVGLVMKLLEDTAVNEVE